MNKSNRKFKKKSPPAWMNECRADVFAPANLPPLETMIEDIDTIAGADAMRVEEYAPPANVHIFSGRDFGFDKFVTQDGESHTESEMISEIDRLAWVPESTPPMKIHVLANRLGHFALFSGCHV